MPVRRLELRKFGGGEERVAFADLARLHAELLGHSPVVGLGPRFVRDFYYKVLPRLDLIFGYVAYVDEEPAGFIVVTEDSDGFMGRAIRQHWFRAAGVLAMSVMGNPLRLRALWQVLQIMRGRTTRSSENPTAELLSFGVREPFRKSASVRKSGIKLGRELYSAAVSELLARDCNSVKALVDKENKATQLMYSALGWHVSNPDVEGWEVPQVELTKHFREEDDH